MLVLVVDDQRDLLVLTAELLEVLGFDVLLASDGPEALAMLRNRRDIEVLLTDLVMPGMNGIELGEAARREHVGISVILTSGYCPPGITLPATWCFLAKPYHATELLDAIRRAN